MSNVQAATRLSNHLRRVVVLGVKIKWNNWQQLGRKEHHKSCR